MKLIAAVICLLGIESIGAYLIMHDHATLGGWMCILMILGGVTIDHRDAK